MSNLKYNKSLEQRAKEEMLKNPLISLRKLSKLLGRSPADTSHCYNKIRKSNNWKINYKEKICHEQLKQQKI